MEALYQQFLGTGPMAYTADLLRETLCGCSEAESRRAALEFYAPVYMLIDLSDAVTDKSALAGAVKAHIEDFVRKLHEGEYSKKDNVRGKAITEYLMKYVKQHMGSESMDAQKNMIIENAVLAAKLAVELNSAETL